MIDVLIEGGFLSYTKSTFLNYIQSIQRFILYIFF